MPIEAVASVRRLAAAKALTRAHPLLYVAIVATVIFGAFLYKQRIDGIFACGAAGYRSDAYLSDCASAAYGDYDHGAFWFGLEPPASSAAAAADVLFIGNSRLQFAMSTAQTREWFAAAGIDHYLLGFSHSETAVFTAPLLRRIAARPKAVVVNVDRFFDDRESPPMVQIKQGRDIESRYREKRTWQALHRRLCGRVPALCGGETAVFREQTTGAWEMTGRVPGKAADTSDGTPSERERWPRYIELGEQFIASLGVDRRCVVLTVVPTVETKRAEAEAIAAALKLDLVVPPVDVLRTFDGSHLDRQSAARWSAAFLDAAGERLRKCAASPVRGS
jgi:hypothetical protein